MEDESEIWGTPLKKIPSPSPPPGERTWSPRTWSQSSFNSRSPSRSSDLSHSHSHSHSVYHASRRSLSFTSEKGESGSDRTERTGDRTEMRITPTKKSHSSPAGYHPMYHSARYDHSATPPTFRRPLFHSGSSHHAFSPSTPYSPASPWHFAPAKSDPNPEKVSSYFSSPSPSFGFSPRYSASPFPLSTTNSPFSFGLPPATDIAKDGTRIPKCYSEPSHSQAMRSRSPDGEIKSPSDRLAEPRVTPQRASPFPRTSNRNTKSNNKPKPRPTTNNNNPHSRSVNSKKPPKKCLNLENKKYPQLLNGKQKIRYEEMESFEDIDDLDDLDDGEGEGDEGKDEWKESGGQGPPPKRLTPAERLQARQRQIDLGKNTEGYKHYLELCPKHQRKKWHPRTPDKTKACSKRSWDGMVRKWRRMLHRFDPTAN